MIAALYVQTGGCYFGLPHVDPWDESQDARLYAGPWPVVAHPPCQRWGRFWHGGPSAPHTQRMGDDRGCFGAHLVKFESGLYLARFALDALSMGDSLICVSAPIGEKVIGKTWAICRGDDTAPVAEDY